MFNSNTWPNSVPLQDIRLRNLSDLKGNRDSAIAVSMYGFLLTYMVTTCLSLTA